MTGTTASTITPLIVDFTSPPPAGDKIRDAFEKTQTNINTIADNFNKLITGGTLPFISAETFNFTLSSGNTLTTLNSTAENINATDAVIQNLTASSIFVTDISGTNVSFTAQTLNVGDIVGISGSSINVNEITSESATTANFTVSTIFSSGGTNGTTNVIGTLNISEDVIVGDDLIAFGVSGTTAEFDNIGIAQTATTVYLNASTIEATQINATDITVSGGTLQTLAPITQHKESFTISQSGTTRESVIMARPFTVNGIVIAGVDLNGEFTNVAFDTLNPVNVDVYLNGVIQQSFELPFANIPPAIPATYSVSAFTANAESVISVGTSGNAWDGSNKNVLVTLRGNLIL